jgi:hypothetical protein
MISSQAMGFFALPLPLLPFDDWTASAGGYRRHAPRSRKGG